MLGLCNGSRISLRVETEYLRRFQGQLKKSHIRFSLCVPVDLLIYLHKLEIPGRDFHRSISGNINLLEFVHALQLWLNLISLTSSGDLR
jgi:hypothetical protein